MTIFPVITYSAWILENQDWVRRALSRYAKAGDFQARYFRTRQYRQYYKSILYQQKKKESRDILTHPLFCSLGNDIQ